MKLHKEFKLFKEQDSQKTKQRELTHDELLDKIHLYKRFASLSDQRNVEYLLNHYKKEKNEKEAERKKKDQEARNKIEKLAKDYYKFNGLSKYFNNDPNKPPYLKSKVKDVER